MKQPLAIFDLDGTLANHHHRLYLIDGFTGTKQWEQFHMACFQDKPFPNVLAILFALLNDGYEIRVWSGRNSLARSLTVGWLLKYGIPVANLRMRAEKDRTVDYKLKESWLLALPPEDRERLVFVFDDRQSVVDMWRRNGVTCCQVAPGDF